MNYSTMLLFTFLTGCVSSTKPEAAHKDQDEKFSITAARIKLAHDDCKNNNGIKIIIGGPKDRTICKNGAVFLGEVKTK